MGLFTPTRQETLEDQERYTRARLTEVACHGCLARVLVKKNSEQHTAVQWTGEALSQCAEFARMAGEPGGRPVYAACSTLTATIESSVADGTLEVGATDGY